MSINSSLKLLLALIMLAGSLLMAVAANAAFTKYSYDELDRLMRVDFSDGTIIIYSYDELGNRTQKQVFPPLTIVVSSSGCGTVTPATTSTVVRGSNQTYTFQASPGSYLADVNVDGVSIGIVPSYTLTNITASHTLTVKFIIPDGDMNQDGVVNITDAVKVQRVALNLDPLTPLALAHGDVFPMVNGIPSPDGHVTADDVNTILSKAVGLINWNSTCVQH